MPENQSHARICGAKTRSGKPCQSTKVMANGRCRMHGGNHPPPGPGHHNYKHGRYSKAFIDVLPDRMRDNFLAAFNDPDLLSHRSYVALHEARVIELLDQLKSSDAGDYRARLLELWNALETANAEPVDAEDQEARTRKAVKITGILNSIGKLIKDGAAEDDAWQAVAGAMRDRQQSATQEHRRLVELQGVLTIDQAMALVVVLSDIVKSEVSDLAALGRIGQKIQSKLGIDGPIPARVAKAMEKAGGQANVVEAKVVDLKVNEPKEE